MAVLGLESCIDGHGGCLISGGIRVPVDRQCERSARVPDAVRDSVQIDSCGDKLRCVPVPAVMKSGPDGHEAFAKGAFDVLAPRSSHDIRMPRLRQGVGENELVADAGTQGCLCLLGTPRAK